MERMLTPKDIAARLGVSHATAGRLLTDGTIPVLVLADRSRRRLLRVREDDFKQHLRSCEAGRTKEQPA